MASHKWKARVIVKNHGQKSVTVSGLKRGLVYPKKFLVRMRSCIRLHTANYGERRKGFEQK